ncbi:MAG: Fe-S cluster protein [Deltaproteobacteria bacterium]|nr:MAG: Fe-S cluster protein [Deltaproteobacteria bacterium]
MGRLHGDVVVKTPLAKQVFQPPTTVASGLGGGYQFFPETPSLTLKFDGKLITLYPRQIAINIVKDESGAEAILRWLKQQINDTWDRRPDLEPSFKVALKPRILEILKILPRTNCRDCGQPTCLVFASRLSEGVGRPEDCPGLDERGKGQLQKYLGQFHIGK